MSRYQTVAGGHRYFVLWLVLVGLALAASPLLAQPAADLSNTPVEVRHVSLWSTIVSSGVIGLLILLMSLVAVSLVVEHLISIRRDRMVPSALVDRLETQLEKKSFQEARETCAENQSFLAKVISAGLRQIGAMFGFFDMQSAMQEASEREVSRLYRKLEYLSFIATTAPMLGLLGTVLGMIRAFNTIAETEGTAKPSQLADGIREALVTTCMGLIVAIPTMFFLSYFRNRIDGLVAETEGVVEKLMGRFRSGAK